jgi:SAM-dependent methyltransferase
VGLCQIGVEVDKRPSTKVHPRNFVEWDVRNWSRALDFWTSHTSQDFSQCSALELGARNGGLSLWLALQGVRVLCSDADFPSERALVEHQSQGVSHLIQYRAIDAANIPFEDEFDLILFKSLVGAIGARNGKESQATALMEMHKALKKGGELFFAENLVGSPLHQSLRKHFIPWGNSWRYVSIKEMLKLMSPFSNVQYCTLGFSGAFGRSEWQRNLLGILDKTILDYIVPSTWRYIIVGVARK